MSCKLSRRPTHTRLHSNGDEARIHEFVTDMGAHGQESLGVSHRLEAPQPPLSLAGGLVRVLGAVVYSPPGTVSNRRHDFLPCSTVAWELIRRHVPKIIG